MDQAALLISQLTDIFRIGLLAGLIYTMENTRQQTGVAVPLIAGIAFVAVILPLTMPVSGVSTTQAIVSGLFANAFITALLWLIWSAVKKWR